MRVIPPIALGSGLALTSSDAPTAGDPAVWNSGTAYTVGATCSIASTHKIYYCLVAVTGGDSPEISITRAIPKWLELSATNQYAMFDLLRNTQTTATTTMTVVTTLTQSVDALALLNMSGITGVTINATSSGVPVYSNTIGLNNRNTYSWYSYFYGYFRTKAATIVFDLPTQYSNLVITVVFSGAGTIGVGAIAIGTSQFIGSLQKGAVVDALNFSTIDRDTYGNANLIPRRNVPKTNQKLFIDKSQLDTLLLLRDTLDATTAVWSGLDDDYTNDYFDALLIMGFYRSWSFQIDNPIGPMVLLELEEV